MCLQTRHKNCSFNIRYEIQLSMIPGVLVKRAKYFNLFLYFVFNALKGYYYNDFLLTFFFGETDTHTHRNPTTIGFTFSSTLKDFF